MAPVIGPQIHVAEAGEGEHCRLFVPKRGRLDRHVVAAGLEVEAWGPKIRDV